MIQRPILTVGTVALVVLVLTGCASTGGDKPAVEQPRAVPDGHTGPFTTYWTDERPREVGDYRDGRRHGTVVAYYPSGELSWEGTFENGVPVGEIRRRFKGGGPMATEHMKDGQLDGPRVEYFETGEVRVESVYRAGFKHGPEVEYHGNGVIASEGSYTDGEPSGRWLRRDETGRVTAEERYFVTSGERVGYLETVFDAAGDVNMQTHYVLDQGIWDGRVTLWHGNGHQAGLVEYRDGLRQGRDVTWDENGVRRIEGRRASDLRVGTWTYWDAIGAVERTVDYQDGVEVGATGS